MREVVRGFYGDYRVKKYQDDKEVKRIFHDESMCETFGWDIYTLYRQPVKRMKEFAIILDERGVQDKIIREKSKNEMRSGRK